MKGVEQEQATEHNDPRLPRGYLSHSAIATYLQCARRYMFKYEEDHPQPTRGSAVRGRGVHAAAEHLLKGKQAKRIPSLEETRDVYSGAFEADIKNANEVLVKEDETIGSVKDVGYQMIDKYYDVPFGKAIDDNSKAVIPAITPESVEVRMLKSVPLPEADPVPILAYVDLIEPTAIRDLKTRGKKGTQHEVEDSLQLSLYSILSGKPEVSYDMLVSPTKTMGVRFMRFETVRTEQQKKHALNVIQDVAEGVRKRVYPRTNPENWWCSEESCEYWRMCRGAG